MTLMTKQKIPGRWRAAYAWSFEDGGLGLAIRYFRRQFLLNEPPETFIVYVTADSRYRLWVNEQPMGRGPLKGTLSHYHYEAYDIAPYLTTGNNLLAAEVRWFGKHAPTSEVHSSRPGFLFQGPDDMDLDTPGRWKVWVDHAITPDTTPYIANADKFLGHWEQVDGRAYPQGWMTIDFDDSTWSDALNAGVADVAGNWGEFHPLQTLVPRDVPALIEVPRRFVGTIQDKHKVDHLFGELPLGWSLDAGQSGEIILDAGALTTGYPQFVFSGGEGREINIIYGECVLQIEDHNGYRDTRKAVRDDFTFGDVHGYQDTLILPGGDFQYEPFHWRTFWFIKIRISAGETPVRVVDARYSFTTYPQSLKATFDASLPDARIMWDVSWRTLQLCAHETYEDCPYFEQLNYIADSRLQALCSLVLTGETALPRRTIRLYHDSVRPDGLIHSRVPSVMPQVKPYFALLWILMVEDYWRWTADRAFVRSNLNVVDSILWFFREHLSDNGFVGRIPFWHMVDHAPGWHRGTPPAIEAGASTYLTSLYIVALDTAIRLHIEAGFPKDAARWQALVPGLRDAVRDQAWSETEGLFLEGPGREDDGLSQHSQVMAILADVATSQQARRILERLTSDPILYRMQFMQSFYLARALEKAGGYAEFAPHVLSLWRDALAKHVTTWPEYPDPTRSDCHAWSSWIAADFVTCILGIQPYHPGFSRIRIAPHIEVGTFAHGRAPTPHGPVTVDWRKDLARGVVALDAQAPEGIPTLIVLPGTKSRWFENGGKIHMTKEVMSNGC